MSLSEKVLAEQVRLTSDIEFLAVLGKLIA